MRGFVMQPVGNFFRIHI